MSNAWKNIEIVRNKLRPNAYDYIEMIFDEFVELHGDRLFGDDSAIVAGIASLGGTPVTFISHLKGKNLEQNKKANFAMAHPEGYRKALRLMKQAEKFHRPIICFIDTPGAFCGVKAEERGQGEAIARNLFEMMRLRVPIISVVLGEGGSGGALALGVCDELAMLENATYSVISPRGFASLLWKDPQREKEAAEVMKITARDLRRMGIADRIIKEPAGGAHKNQSLVGESLKAYLLETAAKYLNIPVDILLENRYNKFRKIGCFSDDQQFYKQLQEEM